MAGIINRLVTSDPMYYDSEWGATCHFCGAQPVSYEDRLVRHTFDCLWMEARESLGIEPDDEHDFIREVPWAPPLQGPYIPSPPGTYHPFPEWYSKPMTLADYLPKFDLPRANIAFFRPPDLNRTPS